MTDDRRLLLEQFFDGEVDEARSNQLQAELLGDAEAARYLLQLAALRNLARRHDPAAAVRQTRTADNLVLGGATEKRPVSSRRRPGVLVGVTAMAAAAALVWLGVAIAPRPIRNEDPPFKRIIPEPRSAAAAGLSPANPGLAWRSFAERQRRQTVWEIEMIHRINAPGGHLEALAQRLLAPRPTSSQRRRSSAREILAIELANASTDPAMQTAARAVVALRPGSRRHDSFGQSRREASAPIKPGA